MEHIASIFTNHNFLTSIPLVALLLIVIALLVKALDIRIRTTHLTIGGESRDSFYERKIIQEQCSYAHEFLMGLQHKIEAVNPERTAKYEGWFTLYVIEVIYDEIVTWITFNHIAQDEAYIFAKQMKITAKLQTFDVLPEFRTPEFKERMNKWVSDVIHGLIRIREVYQKEAKAAK